MAACDRAHELEPSNEMLVLRGEAYLAANKISVRYCCVSLPRAHLQPMTVVCCASVLFVCMSVCVGSDGFLPDGAAIRSAQSGGTRGHATLPNGTAMCEPCITICERCHVALHTCCDRVVV